MRPADKVVKMARRCCLLAMRRLCTHNVNPTLGGLATAHSAAESDVR